MNSNDNVVSRLKQRLKDARSLGFKVRLELLDDEHASWCEIAGVPTLFVDFHKRRLNSCNRSKKHSPPTLTVKQPLKLAVPKPPLHCRRTLI